jgi:hypothetical protein
MALGTYSHKGTRDIAPPGYEGKRQQAGSPQTAQTMHRLVSTKGIRGTIVLGK